MIEVKMPQLGESVAEGTVTQWRVKVGDAVRREQPLLEVATDKADSDVPSPTDGVIASISAKEGEIVPTGGLLCTIDESAATTARPPEAPAAEPETAEPGRSPAAPSTRKLAREEGVDLSDVRGTGERGRITREDVLRAAGNGHGGYQRVEPEEQIGGPVTAPVPPSMPGAPPSTGEFFDDLGGTVAPPTPPPPPPVGRAGVASTEELARMLELPVPGVGFRSYKVPPYEPKPGDEVVPFNRRRRITADHMVYSQHVSPHVVTVAEIDMHRISRLRATHKAAFEKEKIPLTFLSFVAVAVVKALREYPTINSRVLEESYVKLGEINLGIAVDTPSGLLVANIKNADQLSLRGVAKNVDELAKRARNGKLTADDLRGTTFTISNPGRKGNLFGGAIISQPNVGILRIGEIRKRAVVITEDGEDRIAIHPVMYAALSYDHRVVDGVEANAFLWRIADILNQAEIDI